MKIGFPTPKSVNVAREGVVELHICTQHGNEPAGREACLQQIRNLAFTDDADLIEYLTDATVLFIPTANPDGREADGRRNGNNTDLNRDHLQITEPETIAMNTVVRDWRPDLNLDHHEYGPTNPVLYDDDILYLWPRNLNVDDDVRDAAKSFAVDVLDPCTLDDGYSSDVYGLQAAGDLDLQQTAGDGDDGISRNAAGLRHGLGILVESAVTQDVTRGETPEGASNRSRRVASQVSIIDCALEFMRTDGERISGITDEARANAIVEGRDRSEPTYFGGQDEDTTIGGEGGPSSADEIQDPPFCGFTISPDLQSDALTTTLDVHAIDRLTDGDNLYVSMVQEAEPVIGLLLDGRGERNAVAAEGLDDCTGLEPEPDPEATDTETDPDPEPTPAATASETPQPTARTLERVAGEDRIRTSIDVSREAFDTATTALLARADDFPDALAGSVLAAKLDAPILLTDRDGLSDRTAVELLRLEVTNVVLLGGETALLPEVDEDVRALDVSTTRLGGDTRHATARRIAEEVVGDSRADSLVLARSDDFADALAAGNLAMALQAPIVLTPGDRLDDDAAAIIDAAMDDADVVIAGGNLAVSSDVETAVEARGHDTDRLFGPDRYATAASLARRTLDVTDRTAETVYLASGTAFPDALTAGPAAAHANGLLVLVDPTDLDRSSVSRDLLVDQGSSIRTVRIAGGNVAISARVERQVRQAVGIPR